jgi:diguanylate cyclase (GGDEF)-like protein
LTSFDDDDQPKTGAISLEEIQRLQKMAVDPSVRSACVVALSGARLGRTWKVESQHLSAGRDPRCAIHLPEEGVSRLHARFERRGNGTAVVDLDSTNGTFVNGEKMKEKLLEPGDRVQIGRTTILRFELQDAVEQEFVQHQYDSATRDGLTGCYSKKYLLELLDTEMAFGARHNKFVSLAMIDADHFKNVNDTWGHLAGDFVLKRMAEVMMTCVRKDDVLARYGGEEFAVIMRDTPPNLGVVLGERIRQRVEETEFIWEGERLPVTVSVGIAAGPGDGIEKSTDLIQSADEFLYVAKREGRNRVAFQPPPPG